MEEMTPIGYTNWRNEQKRFGINDEDRLSHIYCIGKTGTGKSTLLFNMALADIQRGKSLGIIDPHGDIAEKIIKEIPEHRTQDLLYFDAADINSNYGFNPLNGILPEERHLAVSELIATFKKFWMESWGPRLEYILRYTLQTLLYYPEATLLQIPALLTDVIFRRKVLSYCSDEHILTFWLNEYDVYPHVFRQEAIAPILNKMGLFSAHEILRRITGASKSYSLHSIINTPSIFIVNLSKGKIGEDAASLLGSMLVSGIQLAAMRRASIPHEERRPFYLFIDEVHSFVSLSFADILAEARKYGLALFITHQYLEQLHEKIRAAIFGNTGTLIVFRVGATDADILEKEFAPVFTPHDLVNLPKYHIYLKLMIDGESSKPFSAVTIPSNAETYTSFQ